MQLVRERERIVAAARRLAGDGQVTGTAGNVSERAGPLVAVTPTGGALGSLTPEQVAVVDLDGEQVDGELRPTSELGLHLGVYRRYGAGAVVHTHPPYATTLSCVGARDLVAGCRAVLGHGVGCVAATCGADGAVVVDSEGQARVAAFAVDVVDTTGCGDAFSAGFLRGLSLGRTRRDAAVLGCAVAGLVAQGLGSDHGDFDLDAADALINHSNKAVSR